MFKSLKEFIFGKVKKEPRPDYVSCADCRHLVLRGHAHLVISSNGFDNEEAELNYCPEHKKLYDMIEVRGFSRIETKYFKHIPSHMARVTESGELI